MSIVASDSLVLFVLENDVRTSKVSHDLGLTTEIMLRLGGNHIQLLGQYPIKHVYYRNNGGQCLFDGYE